MSSHNDVIPQARAARMSGSNVKVPVPRLAIVPSLAILGALAAIAAALTAESPRWDTGPRPEIPVWSTTSSAERCTVEPATIDSIVATLEREMRDRHIPGATIALAVDGKLAAVRALGVRSIETRDPMTEGALFRSGSVTKMMTGLTALLMADSGKLDPTAPIGRIAPELDPALRGLTTHQLLTHTASLVTLGAGDGAHDDAALGARVRGWGKEMLFTEPGDIHSYSSPGYWLAGYVIERASGSPSEKAYADMVRERLLEPLGMERSTFRPTMALTYPLALDHRLARAAGSVGAPDSVEVVRPFPDDVTTWPSGSLFSSAPELARVAEALLGDGVVDGRWVLPSAVVRRMLSPIEATPDSACGYSYGLSVCAVGRDTVARHYGFRGRVGGGVHPSAVAWRRGRDPGQWGGRDHGGDGGAGASAAGGDPGARGAVASRCGAGSEGVLGPVGEWGGYADVRSIWTRRRDGVALWRRGVSGAAVGWGRDPGGDCEGAGADVRSGAGERRGCLFDRWGGGVSEGAGVRAAARCESRRGNLIGPRRPGATSFNLWRGECGRDHPRRRSRDCSGRTTGGSSGATMRRRAVYGGCPFFCVWGHT
jgi:CubicO group peptidase (beta-lactamase class C family)